MVQINTFLVWPILKARSWACESFDGFQSGSNKITLFAALIKVQEVKKLVN